MTFTPTVLFDATMLATRTRSFGIGRYIHELVHQFGKMGGDTGVRLRYAVAIGPLGSVVVDDAEEALERTLGRPERHRWQVTYSLRLGAPRAVRRARADVLHLPHTSATPLLGVGAAQIVTAYDLIPLHYPDRYLDWRDGYATGRRLLDQRRMRRADHVIAISQATADDLTATLGVPPSKITPILLGIDATRWKPEPRPDDAERVRSLGVTLPFVLFVGDGDWRKNGAGMCDALAELGHRGRAVTLAWAGRLTEERRAAMAARARALGVDLKLLGYVPDEALFALYRQALAALFVSYAEGFGFPVLEAMAMGTPVITSDRTSLPEVAGDAALIAAPDRPETIAGAIERLLTEDVLRERLRRLGLARAASFTLRRQAEETLEVYQRVARRA